MRAVPRSPARKPAYEAGLVEIKSDIRLLEWITGTTLAGVLALVIHVSPADLTPCGTSTAPRTVRRAVTELTSLDEHVLHDVGLSRGNIEYARLSPVIGCQRR